MAMLRLDPPVPVDTPRGKALAHVLIDYHTDHHLYWQCFIDSSGESWVFDNTEIRAQKNITMKVRTDD